MRLQMKKENIGGRSMNERNEIKKELRIQFESFDRYTCDHLIENHINKSRTVLRERIRTNKKIKVASSFYGDMQEIFQCIKNDLLSDDCLEQLADYFLDQEWLDPYYLYFEIPEKISGIAFLSSPNHDWAKGSVRCSEYVIIIKKSKNFLYDAKWAITSIYPFPSGMFFEHA